MWVLLCSRRARWLTIGVAALFLQACSTLQAAPATKIVEVNRIVPATKIIEVTRLVPVTKISRVTQIVEVTQVMPVTQIVIVTQLLEAPPALPAPAPTINPPPPQVPRPTAVPAPFPAPTANIIPRPTEAPPPVEPPPLRNEDLLVWYDFEGDFLAAGLVPDCSGNGFDAQVRGSVGRTGGISGGQAIAFSGVGYIQTWSNPAAGRNTITISLWFRTNHPENNYKLASAAWWNGGPGSGWILATHIPEFWSNDSNGLYLPGITNNENYFPSATWVHELVTYDGSRIREYTNGQMVNDWPTTGAAIGQGLPMAVGAWPSFQAYNFEGSIDEFKMFSRALTWQEVQNIYNQGR